MPPKILRAVALAAIVAFGRCLVYGRTTLEAWRTLVPYGGTPSPSSPT